MMTLRTWQQTIKPIDELIVQASAKDGSDSWQPFPIGMCWQYGFNCNRNTQIGTHDKLILCAISPGTDQRRRPSGINRRTILDNLQKLGIYNRQVDHSEYFGCVPSYKFVVSPEGNGIDCHRHYEALLAGAIPIMEHNPLVEKKYAGLPILYTTDYSELTEEYLNIKYAEMIDTVHDFSRLFLQYYDAETQRQIKECGNNWMSKLCGQQWYI